MSRSVIKPVFLAIASGLLYGSSFPPFNLSLLAWISFIPALWISNSKKWNPFLNGLIFGWVANLIIFFWIWKTFNAAQIAVWTTLGAWLLLALVLGFYFSVFFGILSLFDESVYKPWVGGALWVCLEQVRGVILTGFPWALLGHSQANHISLIQISSLTGVAGVSFLVVLFNITFFQFLKKVQRDKKQAGVYLGGTLLFLSSLSLWGLWRLSNVPEFHSKPFRISILQGNIDQYEKWNSKYEKKIRRFYRSLSRKAHSEKPDLIVWPESSIPGWFPSEKYYVDWVEMVVQDSETAHLIGAVSTRASGEFNSAFLINSDGSINKRYDKMHLVPFGEYIPFAQFLKKWVPYLGKLGTFKSGNRPVIFDLNGVRMAPNICYEGIFSNAVRKSVLLGAEIIVNITNDGWYLDSGAPEQHYRAHYFRAIELGRPLIRAANTGISSVVDDRGREKFRSRLLERKVYSTTLTLPSTPDMTLFLKWGNWFSNLSWIWILVLLWEKRKRIKLRDRM